MFVITAIPFKTFKQKINIVKEYKRKNAKVEIIGDLIYVVEEIERK